LKIPNPFVLQDRSSLSNFEAMAILLKRFAYPIRLRELGQFFGRQFEYVSKVVNDLVDFLYEKYSSLFEWDQNRLHPECLERFCNKISEKGVPLEKVFGFIDGTVRPMCRPSKHQRKCYNGHKRVHALKFQSVTTPDGLIVHLFGPIEGRRHDCFLLQESQLGDRYVYHSIYFYFIFYLNIYFIIIF
jgi:hypothetical protein